MKNNFQTVIIIGAPRSGTNMLRDVLCSIEGIDTWPCDEINYIWRHGNIKFESDEFTREQANDYVKKYIRDQFYKFQQKKNSRVVVEKTTANSLRVQFVNEIFPNAKFIYIKRDMFDVIGSAKHRWKASLDINYLMKKARFVPILDMPYYAIRYILSRIHRIFSKEKRVAFWGPIFKDMQHYLKKYSLTEICAVQWLRCVNKSEKDFKSLDSNRIFSLKYEEFVNDPFSTTKKIIKFIEDDVSLSEINKAVQNVSAKSIGKGANELTKNEKKRVLELINEENEKHDQDINKEIKYPKEHI